MYIIWEHSSSQVSSAPSLLIINFGNVCYSLSHLLFYFLNRYDSLREVNSLYYQCNSLNFLFFCDGGLYCPCLPTYCLYILVSCSCKDIVRTMLLFLHSELILCMTQWFLDKLGKHASFHEKADCFPSACQDIFLLILLGNRKNPSY